MADLTPDRLQELRRIAEAATPEPPDVPERCWYCERALAIESIRIECAYCGADVVRAYEWLDAIAAARAEAEALRKHIGALEAFVRAEKACRDHAATCSYYDWKPGACPDGVCKRLMRARDEAYRRALAVMDIADGGATHA